MRQLLMLTAGLFAFPALAAAEELELTRADYVEAMDPELVRRSRVEDRGSDRHFVVLRERKTS